jgi:hypothetical protein
VRPGGHPGARNTERESSMTDGQERPERGLGGWLERLGSPEAALELLETAEAILAAGAVTEVAPDLWYRSTRAPVHRVR